jgi:hypothetical protein
VCMCVCVCVRAFVCAARVCVRVCVCMCVCVCGGVQFMMHVVINWTSLGSVWSFFAMCHLQEHQLDSEF